MVHALPLSQLQRFTSPNSEHSKIESRSLASRSVAPIGRPLTRSHSYSLLLILSTDSCSCPPSPLQLPSDCTCPTPCASCPSRSARLRPLAPSSVTHAHGVAPTSPGALLSHARARRGAARQRGTDAGHAVSGHSTDAITAFTAVHDLKV